MNLFFVIAAVIYVLDVMTKIVVRDRIAYGQEIQVAPFFSLTHVHNTGIAFGLFQNKNFLLTIMGVAIACFMVFFAFRLYREDRVSAWAVGAVLGGALGNLTDRILRGHVTDFLDVYVGTYHWPSFNVADSAICVGAALLFWRSLKAK